jgi:hypothetical protein
MTDIGDVVVHATRLARKAARDHALHEADWAGWRIEIGDDHGALFQFRFVDAGLSEVALPPAAGAT